MKYCYDLRGRKQFDPRYMTTFKQYAIVGELVSIQHCSEMIMTERTMQSRRFARRFESSTCQRTRAGVKGFRRNDTQIAERYDVSAHRIRQVSAVFLDNQCCAADMHNYAMQKMNELDHAVALLFGEALSSDETTYILHL